MIDQSSKLGPLCQRITGAALRRQGAADRDALSFARHAIWERLSHPELFIQFPVLWMDDGGQVQADRGYLAAYDPGGPCRGVLLFRAGLTEDELCARAFLQLLQSRLCAPAGGAVLCGVCRDPAPLSNGESMRLCRSLRDQLRRHAPGLSWTDSPGLPEREQGYLGLPETGPFDSAKAIGYGLCFFAREALHRAGRGGLGGKTLALRGGGPIAAHAAEVARRLGAMPGESDSADLVFLLDGDAPLDSAGAEALAARRPEGVFEGVPLACSPEAADILSGAGIQFAPAIAAGAGVFLRPTAGTVSSPWEAERALRAAMERILRTVRAADPEDLYQGACAAALRSAGEAMVRRGI